MFYTFIYLQGSQTWLLLQQPNKLIVHHKHPLQDGAIHCVNEILQDNLYNNFYLYTHYLQTKRKVVDYLYPPDGTLTHQALQKNLHPPCLFRLKRVHVKHPAQLLLSVVFFSIYDLFFVQPQCQLPQILLNIKSPYPLLCINCSFHLSLPSQLNQFPYRFPHTSFCFLYPFFSPYNFFLLHLPVNMCYHVNAYKVSANKVLTDIVYAHWC